MCRIDPADRIELLLGEALRRRHGRISAVAEEAGIPELRLRHALDADHSQWLSADDLLACVSAMQALRYREHRSIVRALIDRAGGEPGPARPRNGRIDDELVPLIRRAAETLETAGGDVREMSVSQRQDVRLRLAEMAAAIRDAEAEMGA